MGREVAMVADVGAFGLLYLVGLVLPPAVIGAIVERVSPSRRRVKWPLGSVPSKCFAIVIVWGLLYVLFIICLKA